MARCYRKVVNPLQSVGLCVRVGCWCAVLLLQLYIRGTNNDEVFFYSYLQCINVGCSLWLLYGVSASQSG